MDNSYSLLPLNGRLLIIIAVFVAFQACSSTDAKKQAAQHYNPNASLQSVEEVHARYADGFTVSYHSGYKVIKMFSPFESKSDTLRYVLVPEGHEPPGIYPDAQVIKTPVQEVIVTTAPQVAFFELLESLEAIEGVVGAKYIYNAKILKKIESGKIEAFTQVGFNKEKILAMNPDLVMITGGQISQFQDYRLLRKLGIPILVNSGWLETTPLARAEWVKVVAALLNKEKLANKKFKKIAARYKKLKKKVNREVQPKEKPLVINNMPYESTWYVSGGESYMAQYLKDAGADYPWYDTNKTGGLKIDFETAYYWGLRADIWINPGRAKSIQDILQKDYRFHKFKAVKTGQVYNRTKRVRPSGANDFWETGVVRPDMVLHDLINIFHPSLLKNDTMYFYEKLPQTQSFGKNDGSQ